MILFASEHKLSYSGLSLSFFDGNMRQLPFMNGIKAFEAAARTGSFARAADELHVTPAAISRMVHLLEDRLAVTLFERKANRLAPTQAGRAYQAGLTQLFDQLATLTQQVTAMGNARVLTVGVGPTFAIRWLIPRLADFQKHAPEIDVRFATGGEALPFSDDWTCGIKLGDGDFPGLIATPLFRADLTPVCSPALARKLKRPEDLKGMTLLRVTHAADDWPRWFKAVGLSGIQPAGPKFDYYGHAQQAAADGIGIAIGVRPYIDDDLAAGRLVTPFARSVPKDARWSLVYRAAREAEPAFVAFRDWIVKAAQKTKSPLPKGRGRARRG
jgi:LysR family transcriptional regulator, glycine cleavage system transcriptional activator